MTHIPTALAVAALAVSFATTWRTRRQLDHQRQTADLRWRLTGRDALHARLAARQTAEDEHTIAVNGRHP